MPKPVVIWLLCLGSLAGLGVTFLDSVAGVAVCLASCVAAGLGTSRHNVPRTRWAYHLAVGVTSLSVFVASRSPWLALATVTFGLPLLAMETVMRRWRRLLDLQPLFTLLIGATFVWLGRGSGVWMLAIAPIALPTLLMGTVSLFMVRNETKILRRTSLKVGGPLPDFSLPYREGEGTFRLSEHRGRHVLLCFVRGDWCPVCHVLMRIIMREAPRLERHNVKVMLITPSAGPMDPQLRLDLGINAKMAYDEDALLARSFGLIESKHRGHDVPLPVALLIDPRGTLLNITRPDDVTSFTSESRILQILNQRANTGPPS